MSVITKDLGAATAYGYAVEKGYTGTEEEFAELMASYATVGQTAVDAKDAAVAAKTAAQTAQTGAETARDAVQSSAAQITTNAEDITQLKEELNNKLSENDYWFSSAKTSADFLELVQSGDYKNIYMDGSLTLTFDSTITPTTGTVIYGNGATFKRADGYTDLLFDLSDDCELHNVVIDGNKDNVTNGNWSRTVDLHISGDNVIVDNIVLQNGCEAIMVVGSDCIIQNSTVKDCRGNGIHLGTAYRTIIKHNHIYNTNLDNAQNGYTNGRGCIYFCRIVRDTVIDGNYLENGLCGIQGLNTDGTVDNTNVKIINNTIKNPRANAIDGSYQASADDVSAKRIIISNNIVINTTETDVLITFNNTSSTTIKSDVQLIIADNLLIGARIDLRNCIGAIISNNVINAAKGLGGLIVQTCEQLTISGNRIVASEAIGISIDGASVNCQISNNIIRSATYGIYASADSYGLSYMNNDIETTGNASYAVYAPIGARVVNNRIKHTSTTGIQSGDKYTVIKDNVLVAVNPSSIAIRLWGGSDNVVIADNICNENATFTIANITTGLVEHNIVMQGLT